MRLLHTFVLIRPSSPEKVRASGLVIPDTAHERPSRGEVVGVADESELAEGDTVLFSKYAGTAIEVEGEALLMVPEHDIFAVIA
jgi:chaperonin GroES